MSLDFNLTEIKDFKTYCWLPDGSNLTGLTQTIIWASIPVGLGCITEKNYIEFFRRLRMYENVFGAFRNTPTLEVKVTLKDVQRHIGLRTNVGDESFSTFKKNLMARLVRDTDSEVIFCIKEMNNGG